MISKGITHETYVHVASSYVPVYDTYVRTLVQPDYEDDFDEVAEEDVEDDTEDEQSPDGSFSEEGEEVPATPTHLGVTLSNSKDVVMKAMDLMEIMQAIDTENQLVGESSLLKQEAHDTQLRSNGTINARSVRAATNRKFVDFSSAQKREVDHQVSKKTKKRGQVSARCRYNNFTVSCSLTYVHVI